MNIDAAKTSDLPELLALVKASSLPVAGIEQHLDKALVARDKGTLIGCAAVEIYGSVGLLRSVAVAAGRTATDGAGVLGLTAETPDQVRPMISKALEHDGPALVEVLVHRQELSMPPTITLEQMKGFSVFALKAVLSGRGDEIVDLARVNLFR